MTATAQRTQGDGQANPSGLRALVGRRDFRRLLIGQGISGLGDWMATVALMALVLTLTGSSTAVGVILVLRLLPATVAGPLTTRVVRRWNRRHTMLAMDLGRAAIVCLIPLVAAVWWVYFWAFVLEVAGLIFLPARDAAVPDLAGDHDLPLANGLVLGSSYGTMPLGAAAFGLVASFVGGGHGRAATSAVFWVDGATFLASFAMIWRIRTIDNAAFEKSVEGAGDNGGFFGAFRLRPVRMIAPAAGVVAVGLGALFSLGIVFVRNVLGASNAVGLGILRWLGGGLRVVRWAVVAQGITVAGMSLAPNVQVAFAGAVGFGAATAMVLTGAMSELQERLDDYQRVMALAAFHVIIRAGLAAAAVGAGLAADVIRGVDWPLIGTLPPARVVLLVSGLVVVAGALGSSGWDRVEALTSR
jgi:MFS family permease